MQFNVNGPEKMRISSLGNLHLVGQNDTRIQLGTSGTGNAAVSNNTVHIRGDDDWLKLNAAGNGGFIFEENGDERMRIDSSGRVTMPSQPSFRASSTNNAFTLAANTTFPMNTTEHNIGNCFNTSTYKFTAPIAGTYFFHFYTIYQSSATNGHLSFAISGSSISRGQNVHFSSTHTGWHAVHHSGVFKLAVGTTVHVQNGSGSRAYHGNAWASFSGYLIG
jgi:hypothetical protein